VEATLLSINKRKFRGVSYSLLDLLFSREEKRGDWEGIAPLHSVPRQAAALQGSNTHGYDLDNPMLYPLFRDLSQVLKQVSRPVAAALQRYVRVNTQFLGELRIELAFYLGAARLIERIRAGGLPVCRPELAPQKARVCELEATYNLNLAVRTLAKGERDLSRIIITNNASFGPEGRIFVLTGPNQGGKTTYTQAIGLVQVLAQAGLYVPGTRARISPVDNIYTHFPVEEQPAQETGRLGEEAQRLGEIFARATRHSLVLLNESLSSTSPGESLYLARDIVGILRLLGARAVYSTHIHELAAAVDELNRDTPGDSTVISLISLVSDNGHAGEHPQDIRRTYRIVPGPPMGRSYAREIASRYGISYEQLEQLLRARGVLDEED
jgi:DNA mismatch repair ATPase MutS